jgi:hypothetical protein
LHRGRLRLDGRNSFDCGAGPEVADATGAQSSCGAQAGDHTTTEIWNADDGDQEAVSRRRRQVIRRQVSVPASRVFLLLPPAPAVCSSPPCRLPPVPAVCSCLCDKLCPSQNASFQGTPLLTWKPQCEVHAHGNQSGFVGNTRLPSVQGEG